MSIIDIKKNILIINSIFFFTLNAKAESFDRLVVSFKNHIENVNWKEVPNGITKEMILKLQKSKLGKDGNYINIYPWKGSYVALKPCWFEVLVWRNNDWENIYKGKTYGYNCGGYFFIKDNIIQSLGNYGFWRSHSELVYFDEASGGWENSPNENIPTDYAPLIYFTYEKKIYSVFGNTRNDHRGIKKEERNGYILDMNLNRWENLKIDWIKDLNNTKLDVFNFESLGSIETKDFALIDKQLEGQYGSIIINKIDKNIYFKNIVNFGRLKNDSPLIYINDNKVIFFLSNGETQQFSIDENILNTSKLIAKIQDGKTIPEEESALFEIINDSTSNTLIITFLILIFIFSIYKIRKIQVGKQKNGNEPFHNANESEALINKIRVHSGKVLQPDEFDELLQIHDIKSLDYRKVKRSRLITEINKVHQDKYSEILIERTKDSLDGRIILYKIL